MIWFLVVYTMIGAVFTTLLYLRDGHQELDRTDWALLFFFWPMYLLILFIIAGREFNSRK